MKLSIRTGEAMTHVEPYQKLISKLIYLTLTRLDIAFTLHVLSKFMHQPTNIHMQAAKRVLRYLAGSPRQGILLANNSSAQLQAYRDRGGCASARRTTSGFLAFFLGGPLSLRKQKDRL